MLLLIISSAMMGFCLAKILQPVRVWVVGRLSPDSAWKWQLQGIFITKKAAMKACKDESWFIGPLDINKPLPTEEQDWEGCYYPLAFYDPRGEHPQWLKEAHPEIKEE